MKRGRILSIPPQKIIKSQRKRANEEWNKGTTKQKTVNKRVISKYLSIIILNVNELSFLTKRQCGWMVKKGKELYVAYKRFNSNVRTHTKWREEKIISWKWKQKESWGSYTYIRSNGLSKKYLYKRQWRTYILIKGSIWYEDVQHRSS